MHDVLTEPRSAQTASRTTGTVRWFSPTHGYGMVQPDSGAPDVFVAHEAIAMDGFRTLRAGQCIEYEASEDAHGPTAARVRPC